MRENRGPSSSVTSTSASGVGLHSMSTVISLKQTDEPRQPYLRHLYLQAIWR